MHDEWQARDWSYLSEGSIAMLYPERDTDPDTELTRIKLEFSPFRGTRSTPA